MKTPDSQHPLLTPVTKKFVDRLTVLVFVACFSMFSFLSGCSQPASEKQTTTVEIGDGIQVDAPGVDVKVGGGEGVQVDAPGAKVDIGGEK